MSTSLADHTTRAPALDLAGDEPRLPTAEHTREVARRALDEGATHYTERAGIPALRRLVADRLYQQGRGEFKPDGEVLITSGDQEALFLALQVLTEHGDEVLIVGPTPMADVALVRMVGAAARIAEPAPGLILDADAVAALAGSRTRLLLLRLPSSVGLTAGLEALAHVGRVAADRDLTVVLVESGAGLSDDPQTPTALTALTTMPGFAGRTVRIGGFAEAGLGAWRVGWAAAPAALMAPMRGLKQELSICSPAVSQHAALAASAPAEAAAAGDPSPAARELAVRRAAAAAALNHTLDASGLFLLIDPGPHPVDGALNAAHRNGVTLADGATVGAPGWLCMTLAADPETLGEAARRVAEALAP